MTNNWTLGSLLFWFALAIFVPGVIVHFTLGRKGGHHLFDKDKLTSDQVKDLPFAMIRKRTAWNLKGSAATIIGLAVALLIYPVACAVGLPINVFGVSDQTLIFFTAGGIVLLITLGWR